VAGVELGGALLTVGSESVQPGQPCGMGYESQGFGRKAVGAACPELDARYAGAVTLETFTGVGVEVGLVVLCGDPGSLKYCALHISMAADCCAMQVVSSGEHSADCEPMQSEM
jgi:hypothetical protein